jgi:hypothetical protein
MLQGLQKQREKPKTKEMIKVYIMKLMHAGKPHKVKVSYTILVL